MTPSLGEEVKQLEHSYTTSKRVNWCTCFGDLAGSLGAENKRILK